MKPSALLLLSLVSTAAFAAPPEFGKPLPVGPALQSPTALAVDVDGTIYVAESLRSEHSDPDLSRFPEDWALDDLGVGTVENRQLFLNRRFVAGRIPEAADWRDLNRDGVSDHRDLGVVSERLLRIEPGKAATVFATGFNRETTGTTGGLFVSRGEVLASISPDIWSLRDPDGNGKADRREVFHTGLGVHVGIPGHNARGIVRGPDGKFYWPVGDKGMNTVAREGYPVVLPDEGCVLRCEPDGSRLEIFARGLRDVRQLAFNGSGDLFGIDNGPGPGNPGRLLQIVEQADYGWRCYYDSRGEGYNPWSEVDDGQPPPHVCPAVPGYQEGAAGGLIALPEGDGFLMIPSPAGPLRLLKTTARGAGFVCRGEGPLAIPIQATAATFGPDGSLFLIGTGPNPSVTTPRIWRLPGPGKGKDTAPLLRKGPAKVDTTELLVRLDHPDARIRFDAQFELAARKDSTPQLLAAAKRFRDHPRPLSHVVWALTRLAVFDRGVFLDLLQSPEEESRSQAARWAGELRGAGCADDLAPLLRDPSSRVRFHAAIALGKLRSPLGLGFLPTLLAENDNRDPWLRHAGITAMRGLWLADVVRVGKEYPSASARLAMALTVAARNPNAALTWIRDPDPAVADAAVCAIYQNTPPTLLDPESITVMTQLAWRLGETKPAAGPIATRRLIAANRISRDPGSLRRLIAYVEDPACPASLRIEAIRSIASWKTPLARDPFDGRLRDVAPGSGFEPLRVSAVLTKLARGSHSKLAAAATAAMHTLGIPLTPDPANFLGEALDKDLPLNQRLLALDALARRQSGDLKNAIDLLLRDPNPKIGLTAARLANHLAPEKVLDFVCGVLGNSNDQWELQEATRILGSSRSANRDTMILQFLDLAQRGGWPAGAVLDLVEVSRPLARNIQIAAKLAKFDQARLDREGKIGPFTPCLTGGDAAKGKVVFEQRAPSSCVGCHNAEREAQELAPPLHHIGAAGRRFILESLVFPDEKVDAPYRFIVLGLPEARTARGMLRTETSDTITLRTLDGSDLVVKKSEIVSRSNPASLMPPAHQQLSLLEVRDLVEYLASRQ